MENQYMEKVKSFKTKPPPLKQPPPPQQEPSSSQKNLQLTMFLAENCVTTPNKWINCDEEKSINDNPDVKCPFKRKINKKEKKKRLNAQMHRLVCPKSALMVFSELYKNVPICLQEHKSYTATLKIDGQVYSGNHISKTQAKQKACENFFRNMLGKKLSKRSEQKEKFPEDVKVEVGENDSIPKPKGPPQEDFPWPQFASLAMYNLINQWQLQPVVTKANHVKEESTVIKPQPKVNNH